MTELSPRESDAPVAASTESRTADVESSLADEILVPVHDQIAAFKRAIEAIVLVAHDPVPPEMLAQLIEQPATLVDQWCEELARHTAKPRTVSNWPESRVDSGIRRQPT